MTQKKLATRAFSLIEIVIVLFLTGIILFCVSGLTDRTFKTLKFLQEKSSSLESATMACERLASEMREMIDPPTIGGSGSSLSFRKVKPSAPYGAGNVISDPASTWTRPYPTGMTAQIVYRLDNTKNNITRQVNSEPTLEVATDVEGFQVSQSGSPGNYQVILTILEDRRAVSFETIVSCPGVPR